MFSLLRIPNVRLLFMAQALGMAASPLNTLLGGIIGSRLAPSPGLATLPVALAIVGLAVSTVPVALLMRSKGRRHGFMTTASLALAGALLAAFAIQQENFWLFCAATPLLGANLAAVAQYRFAVAESVATTKVPQAVSLVLLGTLLAAFLGPFLAQTAEPALGIGREAMAYLLLAGVIMISILLLSKYRDVPAPATAASDLPARPLAEIVTQHRFIVAAMAAAVGYGVMTFLMTATPVSMHVVDGHPIEHTATVIQLHIAAMYVPSLFSGWLIRRFGEARLLLAGIVILGGCVIVASQGHALMHYTSALILLGIGWNFLFVGGTTLLTQTYRASERFRIQAINDLLVFGTTAIASLASGAAVHLLGWDTLLLIALPPLAVLLLLVGTGIRKLATSTA